MTEGYVEYDTENFNPGSPSYFQGFLAEDFPKNDFSNFDIPGIVLNHEPSQKLGTIPDNRPIDALSNYSNSSTNYSTKHSPDYLDNTDQSGVDRRNEDEVLRHSKVPSVLKKNIHKHYEPLFDNSCVYKYEDDPVEYKKARKRIQNRESASRVRSKKKNYVEELEQEMSIVRKENASLRVENATLRAENNLLKQQTCFLERMVMKTGPQAMTNAPATHENPNFEECLLPLVNKAEVSSNSNRFGIVRVAPPHTFKKHATMLALFTIMLCVYGVVSQGENNSVEVIYPRNINEFKNTLSMGVKSIESGGGGYGGRQLDLDQSLAALLKANNEYNSLKSIGKVTLIVVYVVYFIYVLLITNWRYVFRIKNKKIL